MAWLARPRPGEAAHEGAPSHATALVTSSRSPRLLVAWLGLGLGLGLGRFRVGVRVRVRGSWSPWRLRGWVEEVEGGGGGGV